MFGRPSITSYFKQICTGFVNVCLTGIGDQHLTPDMENIVVANKRACCTLCFFVFLVTQIEDKFMAEWTSAVNSDLQGHELPLVDPLACKNRFL